MSRVLQYNCDIRNKKKVLFCVQCLYDLVRSSFCAVLCRLCFLCFQKQVSLLAAEVVPAEEQKAPLFAAQLENQANTDY